MIPSEFLGDHPTSIDIELNRAVTELLHDLRFLSRIGDGR
jgi:hypothetical protein